MFDYRYHALSLAAVLFALAVGVLIGVAIGDSNLVSSAQNGIVRNLRAEVKGSQHNLEQVGARLSEQETLAGDLWPFAVHGLLSGKSVGLVFLGGSSDEIDTLVRDGVGEAAGNVTAVVAVHEPLDTNGIAAQAGAHYAALTTDPALLRHFAEHIGREFVSGGKLLGRVQATLFSSYDGELGSLQGLVVVRGDPAGMTGEAAKASAEFASGLLAGVASKGVPAVGVELSGAEPSQIPWYKNENLASVDDLDTIAGRAALAFALAGDHGAFGVKPTADALLPSPVSLPSGH
jgi:hypothetical protein